MIVEDADIRLAYTYAWWLTGDEAAARSAVLAAVARPEVPGADTALRREILLRRVRAAAISQATMCPASELALLHDGMGLPLDSAAGLAMIDARDAKTELAHGRLEALMADDEIDVVEPERLGGLAVGNPADVAAARQNPKLATLREMIQKGRDELVRLAEVDPPEDLVREVRARTPAPAGGGPGDGDTADAAGTGGAGDAPEVAAVAPVDILAEMPLEQPRSRAPHGDVGDLDATEEVDLSSKVDDVAMPLGRPGGSGSTVVWVVVGLAFVLAVIVLLTGRPEGTSPEVIAEGGAPTLESPDATAPTSAGPPADGPPSASSPAPVIGPPALEVEPTPDVEPTAGGTGDPAAGEGAAEDVPLQVESVGVAVGLGADPVEGTPTVTPFDPVSFVVTYRGAGDGDALVAAWTVDGAPFDVERVDLLPSGEEVRTSRFSRQVPAEGGWPPGRHVLAFSLAGEDEVLAEASFAVDP